MAEQAAKVTVTGTPQNPVFNFDIPVGAKGERGLKGDQGVVGPTPQLKMGEVNTLPNPSDQEWIAGMIRKSPVVTAALTETFPSTMKGDKGDPGGIVAPTISYSGDDANKYTTPGTVYQTSGSTVALNWPIAGKGHLFVIGAVGTVQQVFYPLIPIASTAARMSFTRVQLSSTAWSPWVTYASQRVDSTAGRAIYTWDDTTNREQLIYGDTGWRESKASTVQSLIWTTTTLRLRRVGTVVEFVFIGANPADPASIGADIQAFRAVGVEDIPAAFRPATNTYHMGFGRFSQAAGSPTPRQYVMCVMNATGGMHFEKDETAPTGVVLGASSSVYVSGTYTTLAPWPTTLPGTAVSVVPHL